MNLKCHVISLFLALLSFFGCVASLNYSAKKNVYSTRLQALKFDPNKFISITVPRPLGISLEEVEENAARGVVITEVQKDGNAMTTGKVRKGLFLVEANNIDVKYKTFDAIMDIFSATPEGENVNLTFIDPRDVFNGPAEIVVKQQDGKAPLTIKALKGQNLRKILLEANVPIYGDRAKFTNCGGGMSCGTCVVEVFDNPDWERRPDMETRKLSKKFSDSARLSCNTIIEGDCTIQVQPPRK